jgi:predicted O-methyltransferase YrrM
MLEWLSDSELIIGRTVFALAPTRPGNVSEPTSSSEYFVLRKPRWMVECYENLREHNDVTNVVELGIDRGGSTALLALLFDPARLVAVELKPTRVQSLDDFIAAHGLQQRVRPYFDVDQADRDHLQTILETEFDDTPLDLVLDDASHLYAETLTSFNLLFPRLRPGGLYVIEDWSWQHMRDEAIERFLATSRGNEALLRRLGGTELPQPASPLSVLIVELVLTAGYAEEIVAEVSTVRRGWIAIRRGPAALNPETFDLTASYGSLGRRVVQGETAR